MQTTTIIKMYNELTPSLQGVVSKILEEAESSFGSSNYLTLVAKTLIKNLVETNPENTLVQGIFVSSIPDDITNEELDWETTFAYMKKRKNIFDDFCFSVFKPIIEYLLGIKIEKSLNEDQKKALGTAIAVAAIIHFSNLRVEIKDKWHISPHLEEK
jgi:hypothetical protein